MRLTVTFTKGTRGRWRWEAEDDGGHTRMLSPVLGWDTREQAVKDAVLVLGSSVTLLDDEQGELFAGERDFNN